MLSSQIKISISKDSPVPVKDQLIEQIGLQIASGSLKPRDKLPSIRQLAQKLSIHHSTVTAAYNQLAEAGLLDIRQGSGVRVSTASGSSDLQQDLSLEQLFRQCLSRAAETGLSRIQVSEFAEKMLKAPPVKRILVVDRNEDFHPLLSAELEPHFALPVVPITFGKLSQSQDLLQDSLIVTSFYHLNPLQGLKLDPTRFVVCRVEPGDEELQALHTVRAGSLVAIVSISPTLLKMANNMAAAIRGEEIAVRCLDRHEETEISYLMKHVSMVLCDSPSESAVKAVSGKVPVKVFHLYSQNTIELIKDRLSKWG